MTRILPISQLTAFLKVLLEDDDDLQDLWVDGEISNLTIARSGHAYFTLKDESSMLSSVMWRNAVQRQRMVPKEGDRVIVHGNVTLYEPRGSLQLQVDLIQPQGTGILQLKLEELRQKFEAEGMFDPSRKRPLPAFPTRIGVVTSSSGAVWHDIRQVVSRRYPLAELILSPAIVQGEQAPESIVHALTLLQETAAPDVIIIGRGGGSLEDLWAFNDERVVRAMFAARVPIISAVGHETDITLADHVADLRAPTPSAAAELAVPDLGAIDLWLADARIRMTNEMDDRLARSLQLLDDMQQRLGRVSPSRQLSLLSIELNTLSERLTHEAHHCIERARAELSAMYGVLEALNPHSLMARGYGFLCDAATGKAVRSTHSLSRGSTIRAIITDGSFTADVTHIKQKADSDI